MDSTLPSDAVPTAATLIRINVEAVTEQRYDAAKWQELEVMGLALHNMPGLAEGVPLLLTAQVAAGIIVDLARRHGEDPRLVVQRYIDAQLRDN